MNGNVRDFASSTSSIEYFKKKIDEHFWKEMELMVEMLESSMTGDEFTEIKKLNNESSTK